MRILLQRVSSVSVKVEGQTIASIGPGLLIFAGFRIGDGYEVVSELVKKISNLRIFADAEGKMNHSVVDTRLELLVVSQFTLYGETAKGNRPSFIEAERPELAEPLYEALIEGLREKLGADKIQHGQFGANMQVELINDGPVTLMLEKNW